MPHFEVPKPNRRNARRMRTCMTDAELRFWNAVRAHRLMGIGFRRQLPIAGYITDFASPEHKLIIEIDGASHSHDHEIDRDRDRDQRLHALGWNVVRITNEDVLHNLDAVCTHILRSIGGERSG